MPTEEHIANVIIFASGVVHWLADRGLVRVGPPVSTPRGLALFDQLEASGFRPSAEHAACAILALRATGLFNCDDDNARVLAACIANWDECKRRFGDREAE